MPDLEDTYFCCLALEGPYLRAARESIEALTDLTVSGSSDALVLDDVWVKWLGTLETDAFRRSGLVITAKRARSIIDNPRIPHSLDRRVRLFHHALILSGCGYNSRALIVGGNTYGRHTHLGPISTGVTPSPRPPYRVYKRITEAEVKSASVMMLSMEQIYRHEPASPYRRLRKGFNCWIHGIQSVDLGERLHFFVRSIEAITKAATGDRSRKQGIAQTFKSRARTFVGTSRSSVAVIDQMYDLRSAIEHSYLVMPKLRNPRGISRKEAFALRALQSEIIASTVYSRIFTKGELRAQLRSEKGLEDFWTSLSDQDREDLFGKAIDIRAETNREFRSTIATDIL
jgi:hypothetical protein